MMYRRRRGRAPSIGPKSAPATIVEFSDYQCPSCRRNAVRQLRPVIDQELKPKGLHSEHAARSPPTKQ